LSGKKKKRGTGWVTFGPCRVTEERSGKRGEERGKKNREGSANTSRELRAEGKRSKKRRAGGRTRSQAEKNLREGSYRQQ